MKVSKDQATQMLASLGYNRVAEWTDEALLTRLSRLDSLVDAVEVDEKLPDKASRQLALSVLDLILQGKQTELELEGSQGQPNPVKKSEKKVVVLSKKMFKTKPTKNGKKHDGKNPKPNGKLHPVRTAKKTQITSKPGVLNTIVQLLVYATEKKPVTKAMMIEELKKAFPGRNVRGMQTTVDRFTWHVRAKGIEPDNLERNNQGGYWLKGPIVLK